MNSYNETIAKRIQHIVAAKSALSEDFQLVVIACKAIDVDPVMDFMHPLGELYSKLRYHTGPNEVVPLNAQQIYYLSLGVEWLLHPLPPGN